MKLSQFNTAISSPSHLLEVILDLHPRLRHLVALGVASVPFSVSVTTTLVIIGRGVWPPPCISSLQDWAGSGSGPWWGCYCSCLRWRPM